MDWIIKKIDELIVKNSSCNIRPEILNDTTNLIEDLNFDSISIMALIVDIECEFDLEFEDEVLLINNISSYLWIVKYITERILQKEIKNV